MVKRRCLRCNYEWEGKENTKVCPRCKSYAWNKPRVREKKSTMWNGHKEKK